MNENVKTTSFNRRKMEAAFETAKEKAKRGLEKAKIFVSDNKEVFAAIGLIVGLRALNAAAENREKSKGAMIWDPQAGLYWHIKRPMTLEEKRYYTDRVRAGIPRDVVLEKLRLLK